MMNKAKESLIFTDAFTIIMYSAVIDCYFFADYAVLCRTLVLILSTVLLGEEGT